jgi:hypothetical protein
LDLHRYFYVILLKAKRNVYDNFILFNYVLNVYDNSLLVCVKLYCPPFCEFGAEWIEVCISEALLDANFGNDGKCCYDMRLEDSWLGSHMDLK